MDSLSRRIFNVLFIAVFTAMLGLSIVSPLMPIYAKELGATGIWLGVIFSGFSLARAIFMPIIGKISDRRRRKQFILIGLLLYTIISLLYIAASSVWTLTLVRFLHGFASAMVIPITMAYVGETAREGAEGRRMGLFNIAFFLGMGSGPIIGGLLHDMYGFSSVFIAMAVLTGLSFLLVLFLLPNVNVSHKSKAKKQHISFKKIFESDTLKGLLIYRFVNALGRGGVMSFLPLMAARINITPSGVGVIITTNIVFMAALQGVFGYLADRWNKFAMVVVGTIVGAIGLTLIPVAKNFWIFMILSMVMGLGGAISMPAATAINVKIGSRYGMGTSMGLFNTAMSVGMILAPLISGAVMDLWGLKYVFLVAGGISFIGILIFAYYMRRGIATEEGRHYAH
jgi:DHA1 family multidrug resistance protein-like MFS transporter